MLVRFREFVLVVRSESRLAYMVLLAMLLVFIQSALQVVRFISEIRDHMLFCSKLQKSYTLPKNIFFLLVVG